MDAPPVDLAAERAAYLLRQELRYAEARARRVLSAAGLRPTRHTLLQAAAELYPQHSHTERMAMVEQAQQLHAVIYAPPATPTPEPALPAVAAPADPPSAPGTLMDTPAATRTPARPGPRPQMEDGAIAAFIREQLGASPSLGVKRIFDRFRSAGHAAGKVRFNRIYREARAAMGLPQQARPRPAASKPATAQEEVVPAATAPQTPGEAAVESDIEQARRCVDALADSVSTTPRHAQGFALTSPDGQRWRVVADLWFGSRTVAQRVLERILEEVPDVA